MTNNQTGINAREWSGQEGGQGQYNPALPTLREIFTYMGAISLAVIAIALLIAFNKYTRRLTKRIWKITAAPQLRLLQKMGIVRRRPPGQPSHLGSLEFDLEKQDAFDKERAESNRLSTVSRTYSKMNWEEELMAHRKSVCGWGAS